MDTQTRLRLYALSASFFIIEDINEWLSNINSVILFGSVAQGTASKESDVDIFFDTKMNKTQKGRFQSAIRKSIASFRMSQKALKFKMEGIVNEISPTIGNLEEWETLENSISSTGIILYGRYKAHRTKEGLKHCLIVVFEPKIKNRGAFLNKIYGYNMGKKHYKGFIEKVSGMKAGKSAIIIPVDKKDELYEIMESYNVGYRIFEIFM